MKVGLAGAHVVLVGLPKPRLESRERAFLPKISTVQSNNMLTTPAQMRVGFSAAFRLRAQRAPNFFRDHPPGAVGRGVLYLPSVGEAAAALAVTRSYVSCIRLAGIAEEFGGPGGRVMTAGFPTGLGGTGTLLSRAAASSTGKISTSFRATYAAADN